MARAKGILPNPVIRDHRSEALIVAMTLRTDLDHAGAVAWLTELTSLIRDLEAPIDGRGVASAVVGFGPSFFVQAGAPRFGLDGRAPLGLIRPPQMPGVPDTLPAADVLLYVMTTSEASAARFLQGLSQTRGLGLSGVTIERGFQRADRRELFGFLDGLRNVRRGDRHEVIFVDRRVAPDEQPWTEDGSYMAYLKIRQDLDRWAAIPADERERIMGRRLADGSRLDLPAGSDPRVEGDFVGDPPSANAHVRKSGPRGRHDATQIFRRGVPYLTLNADGSADGGLQFVSFQASLDQFEVVFGRWMNNPGFLTAGAGADRLFAEGLASVQRAGFFFVPPHDARFIGARMFDVPRPEPRPRATGRLIVRKRVIDSNGAPALVDLAGIQFQVVRADDQSLVGGVFETNPGGVAISPDLPVRTQLVLRETGFPPNLEPSAEVPFTLEHRREAIEVTNRVRQVGPYGT